MTQFAQFPQMLYKACGSEQIHGGRFSTLVVSNEQEHADAIASGWFETTDAAVEASAPAEDNSPATREELEQKATELGIPFSSRTSDKKLRDLIAATLEE